MKRTYLFFLIGVIFQGYAQVPIDSLLRKGNFELYEHPDKAIKIGLDVFESKKATKEQQIEALLLVSTGYSSERNYTKSLHYAVKAAGLVPKINNDGFKIITYSRLGVQYQQLKIYNKAHSYLDKAIAVANHSKQEFNTHKLLAFNYGIRGMVYREQMSCEIAQNYFNKSLYHYSRCPKESINDANISVIIYNKGNCFLSLNNIDSAKICYTKSYQYASRINANSLKAFANKGLAEVNTYEGNYLAAIKLLLAAEKMSGNIGDDILNQGLYKGLSDNYLLMNDIGMHEAYFRKYEETTSRIKQNNTKTLKQFILQINTESDAEIKQVHDDWLYFQMLLGIAILVISALLLFEIYRSKKKYKALKLQRETLKNMSSIED